MGMSAHISRLMSLAGGLSLPAVGVGMTALATVAGTPIAAGGFLVSAAMLNTAAGIWQGKRATQEKENQDRERAEANRVFNHDIAKAVARAIAMVLQPLAERKPAAPAWTARDGESIERVIARCEAAWLLIADRSEDQFAPLLEDRVADAVARDPENPALGEFGEQAMWEGVLDAIAGEDLRDAAPAPGREDVARELAAPGSLTPSAMREAAAACRGAFARQLYNDLKHDFATTSQGGGAAFAGVHLRMMGELVVLTKQQVAGGQQQQAKLDAILQAVQRSSESVLVRVAESGGKKSLDLVRPSATWLRSVNGTLKGLDRKADELLDRLKRLDKSVSREGWLTREAAARQSTSLGDTMRIEARTTRRRLLLTFIGLGAIVLASLVAAGVIQHRRHELTQRQHAETQRHLAALTTALDEARELPSPGSDGSIRAKPHVFSTENRRIAAEASRAPDALVRALAAIVQGSYSTAREELRSIEDPSLWTAEYYTALGDTYYFEGRFDEAIPRYESALSHMGSSSTPQALIDLANALFQAQQEDPIARSDRALRLYDRAVSLPNASSQSMATALVNSGIAQYQLNRPEDAIASYTRAIELPGARPDQVSKALVNRGFMHARQGRLAESIADCTRAIDLPGAPTEHVGMALINRGVSHGRQNRLEDAIADYTSAIHLPGATTEQVADALLYRGMSRRDQNKPEDAIADYTSAIELPGAPVEEVAKALNSRGIAHGRQGRLEEEILDYTRAIELPGAPVEHVAKTLNNRGVAHGQQGRPELAIADFTRVTVLPDAPAEWVAMGFFNRGQIHKQQMRHEEAIADFTSAVEVSGAPAETVASALVNRGVRHGERGRPEEAAADYTRVIDLPAAPAHQLAVALVNRGIIHGQHTRRDEAIADFTRVIELRGAPDEQVATAFLGRGAARGESEAGSRGACADLEEAERRFMQLGIREMARNAREARRTFGCP